MPLFFALTLFVSATLLFLVQPMIGKMILPRLGGTPAVWNTCMVFFQALLLVGYAYTHAVSTWLSTRRQILVHAALLTLPFLVLPFSLGDWVPPTLANPIPDLLLRLLVLVGLPFFVVATSAPLLQRWFAATGHPSARDPYFLYGASNLGSMLALACYPLLVEPFFPVAEQTWIWTVGFGALAAMILTCGALAWVALPSALLATGRAPTEDKPIPDGPAVTAIKAPGKADWPRQQADKGLVFKQPAAGLTLARRLRWIALAAVPSSLMLGVTTYLTTDIAPIPFFWVLPLALYLLTFILVFMRWPLQWTGKPHGLVVIVQPLVVLLLVLLNLGWIPPPFRSAVILNLLAFFMTALLCHGELARDRPPVRHLTEFYLWMSVGGVVGGMFNALVAPLVFTDVIEFTVVLVLALLLRPEMKNLPSWFPAQPTTPDLHGVRGAVLDAAFALCTGLFALVLIRLSTGSPLWGVDIPELTPFLRGLCMKMGLSIDLSRVVSRAISLCVVSGIPVMVCLAFVRRPLRFGLAVGAVLLASAYARPLWEGTIFEHRSFFGVQRVVEESETDEDGKVIKVRNVLIHGGINHGGQRLAPARRRDPILYFHPTGPIGQVFKTLSWPDARLPASLVGLGTIPLGPVVGLPSEPPYAVIGLGTGTLAAHARPTQHVTFYEIDPAVVRLSLPPAGEEMYFTYLHDARARGAKLDVVLGDGRLSLKNAPDHYYRVFVIDAFSSDAIPVHLLTAEALDLYLSKLADDGVMVFNITNRYVDLRPILADLAHQKGLVCYYHGDYDAGIPDKYGSDWVVIARKKADVTRPWLPPEYLGMVAVCPAAAFPAAVPWPALTDSARAEWPHLRCRLDPDLWDPVRPRGARVWTDDYTNLLSVTTLNNR